MREFEEKFVKVVNMYNRFDKLDIEFIPNIKVSHTEAHLLDLMNKNPLKKVSELATLFGVTKGAVSQQIKKMEKRGLISRVRHNDNYREVFIELTENGKKVVETHTKFHDIIFEYFAATLDGLTDEKKQLINNLLDGLAGVFDKAEELIKDRF